MTGKSNDPTRAAVQDHFGIALGLDAYANFPEVPRFMAAFSRFEFALKASGFVRAGRNESAEPDWAAFSAAVSPDFDALAASPRFPCREELDGLLKAPPRVQRYGAAGLRWEEAGLGTGPMVERLGIAIRRVRNNLFHGGKDLVVSRPRDLVLIRQASRTLAVLTGLNTSVKNAFHGRPVGSGLDHF